MNTIIVRCLSKEFTVLELLQLRTSTLLYPRFSIELDMSVEIDTVTDQKLQTILLPTPSDPYKLDRISAIMFDDLRSIPKNRGGIDYKPEHDGKRKRQKDDGTAVDLTVPNG